MAITYVDSGLGWELDADFYKIDAGNIATISGRTFYTLTRGSIVFATVYLPATGYTGPVVISTNRDFVAYEPGGVVAQGRFDYLSFTWYITQFSYWMSGNQIDSSGISQKLTIQGSSASEVGIAILKAASVVPTDYARTSTTKIYYNGSSKVIKRLCQIINSVARLGTSHDKAFYGDLGQDAYEHSLQTSGNPHNVTLDDLGIGNIKNQMRLVLDAIGSLDSWITHNAPEKEYIVDHDGDYIVFISVSDILAWH